VYPLGLYDEILGFLCPLQLQRGLPDLCFFLSRRHQLFAGLAQEALGFFQGFKSLFPPSPKHVNVGWVMTLSAGQGDIFQGLFLGKVMAVHAFYFARLHVRPGLFHFHGKVLGRIERGLLLMATGTLSVLRFMMAGHAVLFRNLDLLMLLGRMAGGAIPQGKRSPLPLRVFEVAEIAGTLRHLDVRAHDDLGMAARAAQLLTPPQVAQVKFMVEADPFFEGDLPGQDVGGMASRPQAAGVLDLGVRFGAVFLGYLLNHRIDRLDLDPYGRLGLGRVMALDAGYFVVFRGFPGVIVGSHYMAADAERRTRAVKKQADEKSHDSGGREGQHLVKFRMDMEMNAGHSKSFLSPFVFSEFSKPQPPPGSD